MAHETGTVAAAAPTAAATTPEESSVAAAADAASQVAASLQLISVLLVVGALWCGQVLLIPIVFSVFLSYVLEPMVARLQKWHVPRVAGVAIVMVGLIAGVGFGAYELRGQAVAFVDRIPSAAHTVSQAIQGEFRGTPTVSRMQQAARELESATKGPKAPNDGVTSVRVEEPTFKWSTWLLSGSRSAAEFVAQMVAVVCLTYFLLAAGDLYRRKLVRMVPTLSEKRLTLQILVEIERQIELFLLARAAISAVVGVAVWIAFRSVGLDNAGVWAVLAAVLFTIPVFGPLLIIIASTIAAFVQFGTAGSMALVAGLGVTIGMLEGNVLTPWLMSRMGEMNAVAVFISLLFWGWLWGIWGLLLAVPITAAIKAVCERVPNLAAFAELLKE
jgi:predicted PurR-regulated permease PerM